MSNSTIILGDTTGQLNVTGDKYQGDGYFGFSDGDHTVGFYFTDFVGRVSIEATLVDDPTSDDWFPVIFEGETNEYLEYTAVSPGEGLVVKNFNGNYVWVRAVVSRAYIFPTPDLDEVGIVRKVVLVH